MVIGIYAVPFSCCALRHNIVPTMHGTVSWWYVWWCLTASSLHQFNATSISRRPKWMYQYGGAFGSYSWSKRRGGRNPYFYPAYPSAYICAIDLSKHVAHCEHPHFQRFHLRHHTQTHVSRIPHRVRHATLQTRAGLKPPVNSERRKARASALRCCSAIRFWSLRACVRGVSTALEVKWNPGSTVHETFVRTHFTSNCWLQGTAIVCHRCVKY